MISIALSLLLANAAAPAAADAPLAPAAAGLVQCYNPDDAKKTCSALASYSDNGDGTWNNTAQLPISRDQPITLTTVTPVTVKGTAVCGSIRREDILHGTLLFSGKPIPASPANDGALSSLADALAPMIGKDICTEYVASEGQLLAKVTIDGKPETPDQPVRWIKPSDGYRVTVPAAVAPG